MLHTYTHIYSIDIVVCVVCVYASSGRVRADVEAQAAQGIVILLSGEACSVQRLALSPSAGSRQQLGARAARHAARRTCAHEQIDNNVRLVCVCARVRPRL